MLCAESQALMHSVGKHHALRRWQAHDVMQQRMVEAMSTKYQAKIGLRHVQVAPRCIKVRASSSGSDSKHPRDGSSRKKSNDDMQAKLAKARQYKQATGMSNPIKPVLAPLVRPDTSATQNSGSGSTLETDMLVTNSLQSESGVHKDGLSAFVISEQTDGSGSTTAGMVWS